MGAGNPEALGVGSKPVVLPCSGCRATSIVYFNCFFEGWLHWGIDLGRDDFSSPLKNCICDDVSF